MPWVGFAGLRGVVCILVAARVVWCCLLRIPGGCGDCWLLFWWVMLTGFVVLGLAGCDTLGFSVVWLLWFC